ncbi:MAG TPA: Wzz/FepE/Etk N-terminal domain-containing protein [Flavobacteriales bacterium]|jgi:LPS O-antigen subunit length determinant protein (WzzB/FepE family)|nr:Wzz/FepE/Etk N-terminal domain-containing protein [Flavobacteriales bacterium]
MTDSKAKEADPIDLVVFLWARRRLIIGLTLLAMIAGVVAAYVIRPLYKSEVILFPAVTNSVSKALLTESSGGRDDILGLGDEQNAEQLLQILHSDLVRDRTCSKYDLMGVYRIARDGKHKNSDLREAFEDHVQFEYTKFGSVRVEVLDEEPQRAADMANYIAAQVDSVWRDMARVRAQSGVNLVKEKVEQLAVEIEQMEDSMRTLRGLGVQDYHTQTERYNEYLGAAIVKGDQRAIKEFEDRFKVLAQYGGAYVTLADRQYNEQKRLSTLRMKLEQAQADLESDMPHKFVVNAAYAADKKSYPVRWLVVAVSTISGFLLALLLIIVRENIRKIQASHA